MTHQELENYVKTLEDNAENIMATRNANYSTEDAIHNFVAGAEIMGGTPAQAALAYMTKHFISLRDKIIRNDFSNLPDLLEKCTDITNYIKFIFAIGADENKKYTHGGSETNENFTRPRR